MKAQRIVSQLLESGPDFDPEEYLRTTLMPTEREIFHCLVRLGFTPVEKGRVHTMWEKEYPHKHGGCYRLDLEMEWREDEDRERIPFWLSAVKNERDKGTILVKYLLLPRTLSYILRSIDAWFTAHGAEADLSTARQKVYSAVNYSRNAYESGS